MAGQEKSSSQTKVDSILNQVWSKLKTFVIVQNLLNIVRDKRKGAVRTPNPKKPRSNSQHFLISQSRDVANISLGAILLTVLIMYCFGVNECVLGIITFINSNYGSIYGGDPVVVRTRSGMLRGFQSSPSALSRDGRPFNEFLGVPFAEPPIGDLRFEPPVPVKPWDGVRDARNYASKCLQYDPFVHVISGTEDCLYLNIFTPQLKQSETSPRLPVIVFIHGGLFMFGRAELFRPDYLMDEDVVLVSIHYRLGALGFLNTGDERIRGNMGLKDQVVALKWIQENIHVFGGDPNSVTLLGESAGGASIHYHMMSNVSKGLFHKAVTMSGTALANWAFVSRPKEQAQLFASKLNCPTEDTPKMVACLKNVDAGMIAPLFKEADDRLAPRLSTFVPTVEAVVDSSTMLSASPRVLLEKGHVINKVPWLTGVNSEEGLIYGFAMLLNQTCVSKLNSEWNQYAPILFDYEDIPSEEDRNQMSSEIRDYYMGETPFQFGVSSLPNFVPMFSDSSFHIGLVEATNFHMNLSSESIYLYHYAYRSEHGIAQVYFNMHGLLPLALDGLITNGLRWIKRNVFGWEETRYGVSHADELVMLFQFPYVLGRVAPTSQDYAFSKRFIKIWTSFAKNGHLKDAQIPDLPDWPPLRKGKPREYMNLNSKFELIKEPFTERLKFWKKLFGYKIVNI